MVTEDVVTSSSSSSHHKSSSKHKKKDKEKSNEDDHRSSRRKEDDESSKDSKHAKRRASSSPSPDSTPKKQTKTSSSKKTKDESPPDNNAGAVNSGGAEKLSLSIAETNKLRAQLGLKPLDVTSETQAVSQKKPNVYMDKDTSTEFEHKPAKNLSELKHQKSMRDRLAEMREKRSLTTRLETVKGIADDDEEEEGEASDMANWVRKQKEKDDAARKAKLLEEMDAEFGVSDLVETKAPPPPSLSRYTEKHLSGMRVEHDQTRFREGEQIILTLKDRSILKSGATMGLGAELELDEEEDVLVNPNLADDERAAKNVELKKKKPDYVAFDDEFDEHGNLKGPRDILDKYDEVIIGGGDKKKSFRLGAKGVYDASGDKFIERLNDEHKARAIKLDVLSELRQSADYMTAEEAQAKFKKSKKKPKKLRGGGANDEPLLKADDLLPIAPVRREATRVKQEPGEGEEVKKKISLKDINFGFKKGEDGEEEDGEFKEEEDEEDDEEDGIDMSRLNNREELRKIAEEEENMLDELQNMLSKTRKKALITTTATSSTTAESEQHNGISFDQLRTLKHEPSEDGTKSTFVLDSLSEFCRGLGHTAAAADDDEEEEDDLPSTSRQTQRDEGDMDVDGEEEKEETTVSKKPTTMNEDDDDDDDDEDVKPSTSGGGGKWKKMEEDEDDEEDAGVLDKEPEINRGLGSTLKLALNKGYLDEETKRQNAFVITNAKKASIQSANAVVDDRYDIEDKYSNKRERGGDRGGDRGGGGGGDRDRYNGPLQDFAEKRNYKPSVKLEYYDQKGHSMNAKEAFRYQSHRFHGKQSGKTKSEKRQKKIMEQEMMKKMSSVDTPLNTVSLLIEKQKKLQQPFVVLSAPKGGKSEQHVLIKKS